MSWKLTVPIIVALLAASCGHGAGESPARTAEQEPGPAAGMSIPASAADAGSLPGASMSGSGVGQRPADAPVATQLLASRPYELRIPPGLDRSRPAPLVIYLHGYGADGAKLRDALDVAALARDRGFVYAVPEGTKERPSGRRFWNATPACCNFAGSTVDDVAYLAAVIDDARRRAAVDSGKVFVVGFSNGGFMAHRLACELSDRIAAIASIAGASSLDESTCRPTRPVAVLQVHGDADPIVMYDGGHTLDRADLPRHPSAPDTVAAWARLDGCGPGEWVDEPIDLEADVPGAETLVFRYSGCRDAAVELWRVRGGDHFVAQGRAASERIYDFLVAHARPTSRHE
jgi:polyhydroxybutyrate depolymerase